MDILWSALSSPCSWRRPGGQCTSYPGLAQVWYRPLIYTLLSVPCTRISDRPACEYPLPVRGRDIFCCRLLLSGSAPDSPLSWALRPPRTHPQINPSGPTPRLPDVQRCAETGRGPQPRTGFCMRLHIRVAVCGRDTRWRVASPLMWLALRKSAQSRSRLVGAPPYLWRTPPPSSGEGRRRAWAAMRPLAVSQARVGQVGGQAERSHAARVPQWRL